ncbi:hypothetical protein L6164_023595 [Bauhinia variegata]|uniref:Uncharacterized protein n=1 Tax=Bauhinia variegata TaxID=167791 RepID=A0ACB9MIQ0_BAUVA|nr:hypothetical protein L6164_023595 [Bauhinia variegata]
MSAALKSIKCLPITVIAEATLGKVATYFIEYSNQYIAQKSVDFKFMIDVGGDPNYRIPSTYVFDLIRKTCTCGEFQALHYPCSYVLVACASISIDYTSFVDPVYTLDHMINAYRFEFYLITSKEFWSSVAGPMLLLDPYTLTKQWLSKINKISK